MSLVSEATCAPETRRVDAASAWWTGLWSLLGRTTSSGRLIPAIDGLRSLAILAVVMHHLGGYVAHRTPGLDLQDARRTLTYRLTNVANSGVQLFFVISGFILALPFAEQSLRGGKPVRLGRYFRRRVSRLHPPYLINMAILTLLMMAVKHEAWSEVWPHLLASSVYLHNVIFQSMSTVNGVAWSLEIEIQFYLLAPLLALVYRIPQTLFRRSLICVAISAVILWKWIAGIGVPFPMSGCVFYFLDYFLCGLLLADWQASTARLSAPNRRTGIAWDLVGGFGILGCLTVVLNEAVWVLLPLAFLSVCGAVLRGPRLNWLFSLPALVAIGGMCYTTYLYHFAVISLVGRCVAPWTAGCSYPVALALQTTFSVPAILLLSSVLFVLIEKPFMRRREA